MVPGGPGNRRKATETIVLAPSCATHPQALDTVRSNQPSPVTLQQMELKQAPGTFHSSDKQKKQDLGVGREGGESFQLGVDSFPSSEMLPFFMA